MVPLLRVFPDFGGPMSRWPRLEAIPYARETLTALRPGWIVAARPRFEMRWRVSNWTSV